ncbi:NF-kappa-B inhibitor cactus-like protein, partial [Leptotrombidium deliense]
NYEGETCVHLAVRIGNEKLLERLVSAGADVNAREAKSGKTALHIVVENQKIHVNMAQCLLSDCKADVNVVTYSGHTAKYMAMNMLVANPKSNRLRLLIHLLKEFGDAVPLPLDLESCDESDDQINSRDD